MVPGAVDIYLANAGSETGAVEDEEDRDRPWDVDVMAHVRPSGYFGSAGWAVEGGGFVVTVSAAGLRTILDSPAWSATKHATLAYAEWPSATHSDSGSVVQALCPQGVHTDMLMTGPTSRKDLGYVVTEAHTAAAAVLDGRANDWFPTPPQPERADYYRAHSADPGRRPGGMGRPGRRVQEAA